MTGFPVEHQNPQASAVMGGLEQPASRSHDPATPLLPVSPYYLIGHAANSEPVTWSQ